MGAVMFLYHLVIFVIYYIFGMDNIMSTPDISQFQLITSGSPHPARRTKQSCMAKVN